MRVANYSKIFDFIFILFFVKTRWQLRCKLVLFRLLNCVQVYAGLIPRIFPRGPIDADPLAANFLKNFNSEQFL